MKWNIYNSSPAKNLKQLCHQRDFIRVIINSTEDYASSVIIEIDWTEFELTGPHLFKPRKIAKYNGFLNKVCPNIISPSINQVNVHSI